MNRRARHRGFPSSPPEVLQLTWTVTSGSYRVVVMNTDAAAPGALAGGLDLTIPHLFAFGLSLLFGGIVLIVLGARTRPRGPAVKPESSPRWKKMRPHSEPSSSRER